MEATLESTTSPHADMPRALVHSLDSDLMDVVTLLFAAREQVGLGGDDELVDADNMTNSSSRCVALIAMADEKVRGVIRAIEPYA